MNKLLNLIDPFFYKTKMIKTHRDSEWNNKQKYQEKTFLLAGSKYRDFKYS